ncbi:MULTISPECIES: alanine--tRNA ligase [Oscillospiraceae]|uniref:alanine--tRNA ligase n=1 Tax=Oscillospiraceae TaxID=216572 RepID=UPI002A8E00BB|nr:alanine--tRNA ligase [Dysosmobacter sp.]MDY5006694.1 alanine--tRNA ligase [Candidatus Fournierella merdipullorum]MDY5510685.1 alanine--tRNA ligase [Dysosmobacter sp.]
MQWTGLNELREKYLSFFESKGHLRLGSFPLVPKNDNSLLLINSGMAPMKKWFLGQEEPPRHRVTTCQKCIRTPDIERVGITARHGTYFEMLGNFSFQDYFKTEAINWAWEFLTKVLEIPADLLYISIYEDDDEAWDIWTKQVGIPEDHMVRFGKEDNFWEHGSGPCGPCSEIYFDRGPEHGCGKPGCKVGCDCDRYMEVWNLVFSQFDSDGKGTYTRLEKPNIDTGMGLERLACVMQNVGNLFEVDTVRAILNHVERISGHIYGQDEKTDISIRVITDHIRSTTFMVSDGILPSNEGRGYVLRRLLRRAARHGRMLGIDRPFLTELVDTVIHENKAGYPELEEHADYIKKVIGTEEERFYKTIDQGLNILNGLIDNITKAALSGKEKILSGIDAFKLNDTFGFPLDLTREIAAEAGITVDEENFQVEMKKQKEKARQDRLSRDISGWSADLFGELNAEPTVFTGYDVLEDKGTVLALSDGEELLEAVSTDDGAKEGVLVVLDRTPFYAESGGQVADTGTIVTASGARLEVKAVKKTPKGYFVHTCTLTEGTAIVGESVTASVSKGRRRAIARNHTSAHLLQKALREVLGSHVHQAGSYEDDERVRFDFTHFSAVTPEELALVEHIVNQKIFEALDVNVQNMPLAEAKKMGAMALFGEKYGDIVRVVDINGWSTEFCGGTHVSNTAQLGCFKILSESSVAAGVRRIEGTTGMGVLRLLDERTEMLHKVAGSLKVNNLKDLPLRAEGMAAEVKSLTKELEQVKVEVAASKIDGLFENAAEVNGIHIVTAYLSGTAPEALRGMCEKIRDKAPNVVSALVGSSDGKISLVVCCGKGAQDAGLKAGVLVKQIAAIAGGNGGGKPDLAMAGLKDATKIDEALNAVPGIVSGILQG